MYSEYIISEMPYNLKHSKYTKNSKSKKSNATAMTKKLYKKKGAITTYNPHPSFGVGVKLRTKLTYTDTQVLNAATMGIAYGQAYRLNSLFDPNFASGVGQLQPLYFDQLSALYNRYRVWNATVSVSILGANGIIVNCVGAVLNNNAGSISLQRLLQSPSAMAPLLTNTYNAVQKRVKKYSLPVLTGRSAADYGGSDQSEALIGSDPSDVVVFHLAIETLGATSAIAYTIKIVYDCEFFDMSVPEVS